MDKTITDFFISNNNPLAVFNKLNHQGLAIFSNIPNQQALVAFGEQFGTVLQQDDTDQYGVKLVEPTAAMRGSYFHTDRTSMQTPPNLIIVWCEQPAKNGGESLFCDGKKIFRLLAKNHPAALAAFSEADSIHFGSGNHFGKGALFNYQQDQSVFIKFRYDQLGYFSSPLIKYLPYLLNLIEAHSFSVQLQAQQGYILQNGRWLHGAKTAFNGERHIYRLILQSNSSLLTHPKFGFST